MTVRSLVEVGWTPPDEVGFTQECVVRSPKVRQESCCSEGKQVDDQCKTTTGGHWDY